jgi:hypothetical protein
MVLFEAGQDKERSDNAGAAAADCSRVVAKRMVVMKDIANEARCNGKTNETVHSTCYEECQGEDESVN